MLNGFTKSFYKSDILNNSFCFNTFCKVVVQCTCCLYLLVTYCTVLQSNHCWLVPDVVYSTTSYYCWLFWHLPVTHIVQLIFRAINQIWRIMWLCIQCQHAFPTSAYCQWIWSMTAWETLIQNMSRVLWVCPMFSPCLITDHYWLLCPQVGHYGPLSHIIDTH